MKESNLEILKYNQLWLDYGLLTLEQLQTQVIEFEKGEDKYTEHFRYKTFHRYLQSELVLSDDQINELFDIIKVDPDISMATTMAIEILKKRTLSNQQFKTTSDLLKQVFGDDMQVYIDKEEIWRQKRNDK